MGKTSIEWCTDVWNPVTGCSKVSQGCKHCYAERVFARAYGRQRIESGGESRRREFTDVVLHHDRLDQPLRWKRPRKIFVNSMSDLFHNSVEDEFIDDVFAIMGICAAERYRCRRRDCDHDGGCFVESGPGAPEPLHTFQILTKRPDRMLAYCAEPNRKHLVADAAARVGWTHWDGDLIEEVAWPLPNVWLGVSCEDQATADERIPLLLHTPAAVRFVSAEPLLGKINLQNLGPWSTWLEPCGYYCDHDDHGGGHRPNRSLIDWVIGGGESGPGARPMHPDWVRSLRDQCVAAGVPFFFKQWGEWEPLGPIHGKITDIETLKRINRADETRSEIISSTGAIMPDEEPHDQQAWMMERVGKKAAGCILDGREWKQFPEKGWVRP